MATATLGQINDRLYAVDDLLFKIDTGQLSATAEEKQRLHNEAEWIMDALAKRISEGGQYDYQTARQEREKVRRANRLADTATRYAELYPDPDPEFERVFAKASADNATAEDIHALAVLYSVIFVEYPQPPAPPKGPKGLIGRLFSRH
jgi:hypothetical protein